MSSLFFFSRIISRQLDLKTLENFGVESNGAIFRPSFLLLFFTSGAAPVPLPDRRVLCLRLFQSLGGIS